MEDNNPDVRPDEPNWKTRDENDGRPEMNLIEDLVCPSPAGDPACDPDLRTPD